MKSGAGQMARNFGGHDTMEPYDQVDTQITICFQIGFEGTEEGLQDEHGEFLCTGSCRNRVTVLCRMDHNTGRFNLSRMECSTPGKPAISFPVKSTVFAGSKFKAKIDNSLSVLVSKYFTTFSDPHQSISRIKLNHKYGVGEDIVYIESDKPEDISFYACRIMAMSELCKVTQEMSFDDVVRAMDRSLDEYNLLHLEFGMYVLKKALK
jgi:hypothetical protein